MNLQSLRAIANGASMNEATIESMIGLMTINEAYFGDETVQKIESAMIKIHKLIVDDKNIVIYKTKEAKELEEAVKDTFGFKKVRIYWSNQPALGGMGPYTRPGAVIIHSASTGITYGTNKKGFYDSQHELMVYIQMDQNLVTDCNLTPREMTAILLHEIGHNFDYSPATIFEAWYGFLQVIMSGKIQNILTYAVRTGVQEYGRDVTMFISNAHDYLLNVIPVFGRMVRAIGKVSFNITKFIMALLSPVTAVVSVPTYLLLCPFSYLSNFFARKKEVYSDSFAAAYGYAAEIGTALEKINVAMNINHNGERVGPMTFFYDLTLFQAEVIAFAMGGHRTNQQRMISMLDAMKTDLKDPNLPADVKKDLQKKVDDAEKVYREISNLDNDQRKTFTTWFRGLVDSWYAGKPYMLIKPIDDQYAN